MAPTWGVFLVVATGCDTARRGVTSICRKRGSASGAGHAAIYQNKATFRVPILRAGRELQLRAEQNVQLLARYQAGGNWQRPRIAMHCV